MRQHTTLTGRRLVDRPRDFLFRLWLPYGKWTCGDGREVLFNRFYEPLYERRDGITTRADPHEWVPHEGREEWYYDDSAQPWRSLRTLRKCLAILEAFGGGWHEIRHYTDVLRWRRSA